MPKLKNPFYEYMLEVPAEGLELQRAIWQQGFDGRVEIPGNGGSAHLIVQAAYAEDLLHRVFDLIGPVVTHMNFLFVGEVKALPNLPGDGPDPFCEEAMNELFMEYDPTRDIEGHRQRVGLMIRIIFPRNLLHPITACGRWLAGAPRPDLTWRDFQP